MSRSRGSLTDFLCFWFCVIGLFTNCQILVSQKILLPTAAFDCNGVETFEKVSGIQISAGDRIPLYSNSNGAITADCYNRCRSSSGCSAYWIDYATSECFRMPLPKFTGKKVDTDFSRPTAYFERICLLGDICSKAWVAERVPGFELRGYDDVIIRSVVSRKRCIELCLTDKRLPCRSADFWESQKECRLSREDRRSQPGAFVKTSTEVDYIENTCIESVTASRGRDCEWDVTQGSEFKIFDFTTKSSSLLDCQRTCETYTAFKCRSVSFDTVSGICFLSGSDTMTTSNKLLSMREKTIYAERVPCVDMSLECQGEYMVAKLKSHSPFYGKMFSIPSSPDCEILGSGKILTTISYPFNSCGVEKDIDGSYMATLIVQQHPLIQKRGDSAFRLICTFPEINRTLSKIFEFGTESPRDTSALASSPEIPSPILGIGTSVVINSTAKTPTVRLRILNVNGDDVTGVSLGDELFLKVEVESNSAYGLIARDLIAKSGTKEEELILLDSRGCPEDPAIFPYLKRESADSKSLKSRFEAFKFTNDAVVRFQVHLEFCRHECQPVKCDIEISHGRRKRRETSGNESLDSVELRREIIVSSASTNRILARQDKSMMSMTNSTQYNLETGKHLDSEVCGSKHLVISVIIGFSTLQIMIVFCAVLCVCQKVNKNKAFNQSDTVFHSSHLGYVRPAPSGALTTKVVYSN